MLLKTDIQTLNAAKSFVRQPYAWPGGYPLAAITADGGCLCSDCVKGNWQSICAETFESTNCGFRVSGIGVNWENPNLYCDHCNAQIHSAATQQETE